MEEDELVDDESELVVSEARRLAVSLDEDVESDEEIGGGPGGGPPGP